MNLWPKLASILQHSPILIKYMYYPYQMSFLIRKYATSKSTRWSFFQPHLLLDQEQLL